MPSMEDHQSGETTKLLIIGDGGSGKSGALASLANDGYNVRVLDLDNGLDVLKNVIIGPKSIYRREALRNIHYCTITDPMTVKNGKLVQKKATVWTRTIEMLDNWREYGPMIPAKLDAEGKIITPMAKGPLLVDFGPIHTWTPKEVLVIDSLTFLANAAMAFVMSMNARLGGKAEQSDWYAGQQLIEGLLQMLYDDNVRCNVIINAHITYIGEENGPQRGYPQSLGKALSPKIGRYFNNVLLARTTGSGEHEKRKLHTNSTSMIELKSAAPLNVKPVYPIETGLADYFRDVRSGG